MSHESNDNIKDRIRDLYDLIRFLESELEDAHSTGKFLDADSVYGELVDARLQLNTLEVSLA